MTAWVETVGLAWFKPVLTSLLLPPVPWIALMLLGAAALRRARWLGWSMLWLGALAGWFSATPAGAYWATRTLLDPPAPLRDPARLAQPPVERSVIVVLGGGQTEVAEYPHTTLTPISIERLRYGIWLSRASGLPVAFSGGNAPGGDPDSPSEGEIAEQIAREEFRHQLRFIEIASRDTRENAHYTVKLLAELRLQRLVLVTHDLHMTRALRHFERERRTQGLSFEIVPATVGEGASAPDWIISDFFPSAPGVQRTRYALREWLGLLAGL